MKYKAISADGHVNEPPDLWTSRLPEKFKERGPRVIETPNSNGHAWIMDTQKRPQPLGLNTNSYRATRETLREKFAATRDRGVRYDQILPGSWDPHERVKEITDDYGPNSAEIIFNGAATVWNALKLCPDRDLAFACYQAYNDWAYEFQEAEPGRFFPNATVPTTGVEDAVGELNRIARMGLKTAQLEAYPNGSFEMPSTEDDPFWATAVELDMPINVHTNFFFLAGDMMDKNRGSRAAGIDIEAGKFPAILYNMINSGVFDRFPDLKFVGSEVQTGWIPYFLESFDQSVIRNRRDWQWKMLPSEYFRRNIAVVYTVEEAAGALRYDIGVGNLMWGPDYPHSGGCWPVDYELGRENLERAGTSAVEIERIMWKNAADIYHIPYDN